METIKKETLKPYTVTLNEATVDQAMKIAEKYGGKLSPILNNLLKGWVAKELQNKKDGGSQN
jgi:hypothetical protein